MNIVILGAAGKTGQQLVSQALAAGHHVTAFVREEGRVTHRDPNLAVVTGDARQQADLDKALAGQDAVLNALGTMKAGDELMLRATQAIIRAAQDNGVRRVVQLSSFLAGPAYRPSLMGRLMGPMVKGVMADKTVGDELLARSGLDWTIVYATRLDAAPAGRSIQIVTAPDTVSTGNGIARADVAKFMLSELTSSGHIRAKLTITTK